jgi:fructose-specific phosphotransferase system IIC component
MKVAPEDFMGMSFMLLLVLGGGLILLIAVVVGIVAIVAGSKDRERDDKR